MSETNGVVRTASRHKYSETVARLRTEIERRQLILYAAIDQQLEAERVSLRLPPITLLIFGNPAAGAGVMQVSPEAAIDLPLKILVWQDAEQVWVAINEAAYLQRRHELPAQVVPVLDGARAVVEAALGSP